MKITETRFIIGPEFIRADAGDDWLIEGYASTDAVDSYNEVIEPEAYRKWLGKFAEFPILLLNHSWFDKPVGKILEAEIRPRGLYVKAQISKSAPEIWQMIQEGILKAFSVGFRGVSRVDTEGQPSVWKEIELVEISVVNVPANREALFAVASQKGWNIGQFAVKGQDKKVNTKQGDIEMDKETLDQIKGAVAEIVKPISDTIPTAAKSAAEDAVRIEVNKHLDPALRTMKEVKEAAESVKANAVTKDQFDSELKALVDKVGADLKKAQDEILRRSAPGISSGQPGNTFHEMKSAPFKRFELGLAQEHRTSPAHIRALIHKPETVFSSSDPRIGASKAFQEASDTLYLIDLILSKHGRGYKGPQSLKYWNDIYVPALNEYKRAMDTATTAEGTEWVPTMTSAQFQELYDLNLGVENLFEHFPMPSKTYDWPIQTSHATAYLPGESTADSATSITASTPGTSKVTFTAKKLAVRILTSTEFVEDSIIEALGFIRMELAKVLARGVEDAILNGDTAATHQDSNVTAADDRRKAWLGIRGWCVDQSNSTAVASTFALTGLSNSRKSMGKYGVNEKELAHILPPIHYLAALSDSSVLTWDKFGPQATGLTGNLPKWQGVDLIASEFIALDYNTSGVYDGSTTDNTVNLTVNKTCWKIGDRRTVTIDADKIISTDQFELVSTIRKDLQPMYPTSQDIAWMQRDVTNT